MRDMKYTPAQQKLIDALLKDTFLRLTYAGVRPTTLGFRGGRSLQDKTIQALVDHYGDDLRKVLLQTPKYKITCWVVCHKDRLTHIAKGDTVLAEMAWNPFNRKSPIATRPTTDAQ